MRRLSLHKLEWAAVVAPLIFLGVVYFLVQQPLHPVFHEWYGFVVLGLVLGAASWLFAHSVFGAFRALHAEVARLHAETSHHNRLLVTLQEANLALMRERGVDSALERAVDLAAQLLDARQAAVAVPSVPGGESRIITGHDHASEPDPDANSQGERARFRQTIAQGAVPGSAHSPRQLLAVPVVHIGTTIGTLWLARRPSDPPFTATDEEIARMFATHAAVVVENARLYDEVQSLAVERERQHLAHEMHDGLAQVLGFVNVKAQAVEQYLRNGDTAEARLQMAELSEAAREVYGDIRQGIVALRTHVDAGGSLREALGSYLDEFAHSTGIPIEASWEVEEASLELTPAARLQLVRVVQEALANVRRHARAESASVIFSAADDALEVAIVDDGVGFEPALARAGDRPRLGLRTMEERAQAAGGTLAIESLPGEGTVVRVRLPDAVRRSASAV